MLSEQQRAILQELKKRNLSSQQQAIVQELERRDTEQPKEAIPEMPKSQKAPGVVETLEAGAQAVSGKIGEAVGKIGELGIPTMPGQPINMPALMSTVQNPSRILKPTKDKKTYNTVGKVGYALVSTVAQPSSVAGQSKQALKIAESIDDIANVQRGSSAVLLKDPKKFLKIFTSKESVKTAYEKAVKAGESIIEDFSTKNFEELNQIATTGKTAFLRDQSRRLGTLIDAGADKVAKSLKANPAAKTIVPRLVNMRKMLNAEIGNLKTLVQKGLENEKSVHEVSRKLIAKEMQVKKLNEILDKVAPNFRAADALFAARASLKGFRKGLTGPLKGAAVAAAGSALKQGYRAVAMPNMLVSIYNNYLRDAGE